MRNPVPFEFEQLFGVPSLVVISEGDDYSFIPPLAPEQEAIALKLLKNGVPDDWDGVTLPADWSGFFKALSLSQTYVHTLNVSFVSLPVSSCLSLISGNLAIAVADRPDPEAFQGAYNLLKQALILSGSPFTEDHLVELSSLISEYNIPLVV